MKKLLFAAVAALVLITAGACHKEETGSSRMTVKMTDAPGDFQQVNIDVIEVKVHHSADGWVSLPTVAGIYDLLTLQDSVTTVLVNQGQLQPDLSFGDAERAAIRIEDQRELRLCTE
jgi:hypothetical protein